MAPLRGEARTESDVDLLVLVRHALNRAGQDALRTLAHQAAMASGSMLSILVMTPEEQRWHGKGSSLWRNIQRDGIIFWPTPQAPLQLDAGFLYKNHLASGGYVMTEAQYEEIAAYLQRCDEELATAHPMMAAGFERKAISSCYYAIFNATTALLLTKGVLRAKHSGIRSALSEYLLRNGTVPKALGEIYQLLQSEREMTDDKFTADPPWEAVIEQRIEQAQVFVATVRTYLTQTGFLPS
jgi:uncharacterized protein (UPF0332 family)